MDLNEIIKPVNIPYTDRAVAFRTTAINHGSQEAPARSKKGKAVTAWPVGSHKAGRRLDTFRVYPSYKTLYLLRTLSQLMTRNYRTLWGAAFPKIRVIGSGTTRCLQSWCCPWFEGTHSHKNASPCISQFTATCRWLTINGHDMNERKPCVCVCVVGQGLSLKPYFHCEGKTIMLTLRCRPEEYEFNWEKPLKRELIDGRGKYSRIILLLISGFQPFSDRGTVMGRGPEFEKHCYKWLERTHDSVKWGAGLAGLTLRILLPWCRPLKHSDYSVYHLLTLKTHEFWPQCTCGLCTRRTISNYLFSMDCCINWLIIG